MVRLLVGSPGAARQRRAGPSARDWQPRDVSAQTLVQIHHRYVATLPRPRGPQVQGVAACTASKTVVRVLAQVYGEHAAACRTGAVQRARPTCLLAHQPPQVVTHSL